MWKTLKEDHALRRGGKPRVCNAVVWQFGPADKPPKVQDAVLQGLVDTWRAELPAGVREVRARGARTPLDGRRQKGMER